MLISQAFPSEFLKAADLHDREVRVIIDHVELKEVGDGDKPVVYFVDKTRGLVLNKTNSNNISMAYGDETDDWRGKEVILYPTMVDYQGRSVPAIRVKAPRTTASNLRAANGTPPRPSIRTELNDEVPF